MISRYHIRQEKVKQRLEQDHTICFSGMRHHSLTFDYPRSVWSLRVAESSLRSQRLRRRRTWWRLRYKTALAVIGLLSCSLVLYSDLYKCVSNGLGDCRSSLQPQTDPLFSLTPPPLHAAFRLSLAPMQRSDEWRPVARRPCNSHASSNGTTRSLVCAYGWVSTEAAMRGWALHSMRVADCLSVDVQVCNCVLIRMGRPPNYNVLPFCNECPERASVSICMRPFICQTFITNNFKSAAGCRTIGFASLYPFGVGLAGDYGVVAVVVGRLGHGPMRQVLVRMLGSSGCSL